MQFELLGPPRVLDGPDRVPLGGPQPEKALAALLLAGGRVVGTAALVDALWDGEPPPTATHQVHKVIAGLRRRLPGRVETDGPGYRIRTDGAAVDLDRFTELTATPSVERLTEALALWRGPALDGLDSRALRTAAAALDERRLAAVETLVELRLADGDAAAVAAELPALIAEHPLRETLRRQLMVALYRCGRQAEALAVYAETRTLLARELGLDPGPALARLHQQVLRADPALDAAPAAAPAPVAPCTLPYDLPDFAGRAAPLDRLLAARDAVVINAIDGMAGIGKTALAVHAAHRLAGRYPGGQLFCDLHSHTPGARPLEPAEALELLLRMIGVPPETIPEGLDARVARWRSELSGRRILLVLDNAATAAQVRPLLPGTPGCLTLVTSRRRLGVLDGATVLSLDVLTQPEALGLFAAVAGADRVAAEPAAAADVVRLCGHLPLAVRIAATRLVHRPAWTVAALARRLAARTGRLAVLDLDDRGVGPAFALSYADLPAAGRRMFRLLGLHPAAVFDAFSAAALAQVPVAEAEGTLEGLVDAHLLQASGPGRYTFHDLLREYARGLAPAGEAERAAARARLHGYYLAAVSAATARINPEGRRFAPEPAFAPPELPSLDGVEDALAWLDAEHAGLLSMTAAVPGDWRLPCALRTFFEHRGHFADWRATHERALPAAAGDPLGTVLVRFNLGTLSMWTGRLAEGMDHFRAASGSGPDPWVEAAALTSLGMLAHLAHQDVEAAGYLRRALAIEHGDPRTTALAWNNLGLTEGRLGAGADAVRHHRQALELARGAGSASAERAVLLGLGETSLRLGLPAREPFAEALTLARAGRFRMQEALALDGLAHATGEASYWRAALVILTELGVAQADLVRHHLADPGLPWCDLCPRPSDQA